MPVTYLNKRSKDHVLTIAAFTTYLDARIEEWEKLGRSKLRIKYAKMAKSFTQKVLDDIFVGVDQDQVFKLTGNTEDIDPITKQKRHRGELDKMEVVVKYTDEAAREYAAMAKMDTIVPVPVDDLVAVLSFALASCNLCELCGQDAIDCDIRRIFIANDVDILTPEPGNGCPYRMTDDSPIYQKWKEGQANGKKA